MPAWGREISPANTGAAVTPHDSNDFAGGICDWLHIGGAGVVALVFAGASGAVNITCVAGQRLDVRAKRVNSTNTTATLMVAMYT